VDANRCTFDDVLLDWAIAEVLSPHAWQDFYWMLGEPFRQRVAAAARGANLSAGDRALLLKAVRHVRQPLIDDESGMSACWTFSWRSISREELASFAIIRFYRERYGSLSLGALADAVCDHPLEVERRTRDGVLATLDLARRGVRWTGRPIAVTRPDAAAPLLIEGYKRSMAALRSGVPSLEVYFCCPA